MIEIKNLKKLYNDVTVVNIPHLEIKKGESIGLVGNNGAGKTTLFRMMLDLIRPETGSFIKQRSSCRARKLEKLYRIIPGRRLFD
jgi:ABC-2 type transport system ATP-binding protein